MLIFIDEMGTKLNMTTTHARAPVGERAVCQHQAAKGSNISLVGALSLDGMRELYPYTHAVDTETFGCFLDRLLPKLLPGNVIIMDNLRVHHAKDIKEKLAKSGIDVLYLPPYSPERNPIEESWSLIKGIFRRAGAKNICDYIDTLKKALESLTPLKINGYFIHAGYAQPA
jgi:transposase